MILDLLLLPTPIKLILIDVIGLEIGGEVIEAERQRSCNIKDIRSKGETRACLAASFYIK